jgi:hypothetical protein
MESSFGRSRLLIYALSFILITIMSTAAGAQSLFGPGFPGGSYLEGFWRGAVGCGDPGWPTGGARVYVGGSSDYAGGTAFDFAILPGQINPVNAQKIQHSYGNRGVWIGLTLPFDPIPRLGISASAWSFLRTGSVHSRETFNDTTFISREWQVQPYWTILEALAILRCGYGCNIIGGFRYDHYDISLKNPVSVGVLSLPTDHADLNVRNYIPLVGTQYEYNSQMGSLLFRAVGFPALGGDLNYQEPFAGAVALRATGHYRRGYFFELFMECSKKFGTGQLGLFARWNELHAQSTASVNTLGGGGVVLATQNYDFSFNRNSWTLGGSLNLAFKLPY